MSPRANLVLILVVLGAAIASMSFFVVDERELAIKLKFGEIVKDDFKPGLHMKWPIAETVLKYDDRILIYDNQPEKFLTGEKKNLFVDYFVTWRIVEPGKYYTAAGGQRAIRY